MSVEHAPDTGEAVLQDQRGRTVRYVRLSTTDRCNLRCLYCRSSARDCFIPHENVLRYEEMLELMGVAVSLGVEKLRLTGGEPFARKHFVRFVAMLREAFPRLDMRITTNATMARPHVRDLAALGVRAINVSLDSFQPQTFARITGLDALHEVRAALDAFMEAGIRVKINAVGLRGVNDGEMEQFLDFARKNPVDVRFIEFMPMGASTHWTRDNFWPAADILAEARRHATLTPLIFSAGMQSDGHVRHSPGPARLFSIDGGVGHFGLITPMSNHFCANCNRLRITSDGHLRTCLFDDREYALRGILRHPRPSAERKREIVRCVMREANRGKPLGAEILAARGNAAVALKHMVSIGG